MFVPSKYQQDIFNVIQKESCNLVVAASAGAGKSTTILESTKLLPDDKKVILVAFNKSIAEELGKKVKQGVKTSTLHALGYAIIKRNNPKAKMNEDKVYDYIDKKKIRWSIPKDKIAFFNRIKRMVDLARLNWRPNFAEEDMDFIAGNYGIDNFDNEAEYAWEIFDLVTDDTKEFDFTDMIFMPVKNNYKFLTYDVVYGDEIQDFSSLERDFFLRLVKKDGRFIGVGDENQCIYFFKGSSIDSFRVLAAQPNTKILPLSISYRCSQAVTKWANELVPEMEFRPGAPMGSVVLNGSIKNIQKNDVVLCRLNFPLVSLALEFIQKGVPVIIQGKDIGRSLIVLMQSYKSDNNQDLISKLQNKLKKLIEKLKKKNPSKDPEIDPQVCAFSDKLSIIKILLNKYHSVEGAAKFINDIYSDDTHKDKIVCSSIHKWKGKESQNVFIIEKQLIPSKWARTEEEVKQERNIDFVARTRAIDKLEYVTDWSAFKKQTQSRHSEIMNTPMDPDENLFFHVDNMDDFH